MLTHTVGNARVWRRMLGGTTPYVVGVSAYIPSLHLWTPIREEFFSARDEWESRYSQLVEGFSEKRLAVYYKTPTRPMFAVIQQRSGHTWLFRVYGFHSKHPVAVFWADSVWSLPFEERSPEWHELHEAAQNAPEMRLVERMFGATEQELEDDRLFWQQYVENAPAEAEAR